MPWDGRDSVVQTDGVAELREAYVQLAERESEVVALATHLRDRSARRIQDAFRTSGQAGGRPPPSCSQFLDENICCLLTRMVFLLSSC